MTLIPFYFAMCVILPVAGKRADRPVVFGLGLAVLVGSVLLYAVILKTQAG